MDTRIKGSEPKKTDIIAKIEKEINKTSPATSVPENSGLNRSNYTIGK